MTEPQAIWPAPAKLNLMLRITGRRADGYHELQTVFQFLDLCDELRFQIRQDRSISCSGIPELDDDNNLIIHAARLLQANTHTHLGCDIHIHKKLPMGGGLGGGSSDAATTLLALNRLWGTGLEIDDANITEAISRGLNIVEQNMDAGLGNFPDQSFDTVVMAHALQAVHYPDRVLDEMLRIGRECIVTFPNFGHISSRLQLGLHGRMPVTRTLPLEWYNTTNIHLCTFNDFEALCEKLGIEIIERRALTFSNKTSIGLRMFPNLLGEIAMYRFCKKRI